MKYNFIELKEVLARINMVTPLEINAQVMYQWISWRKFPTPVMSTSRVPVWVQDEVVEWVRNSAGKVPVRKEPWKTRLAPRPAPQYAGVPKAQDVPYVPGLYDDPKPYRGKPRGKKGGRRNERHQDSYN